MVDEGIIKNTWTKTYTPQKNDAKKIIKITKIHTLSIIRQSNFHVFLWYYDHRYTCQVIYITVK